MASKGKGNSCVEVELRAVVLPSAPALPRGAGGLAMESRPCDRNS
jgi:hypothetical protein